jgi:hypothetical protein
MGWWLTRVEISTWLMRREERSIATLRPSIKLLCSFESRACSNLCSYSLNVASGERRWCRMVLQTLKGVEGISGFLGEIVKTCGSTVFGVAGSWQ